MLRIILDTYVYAYLCNSSIKCYGQITRRAARRQ